MIALGPLLLIGVLDDLWDLPATLKLLVQLGAATIVISAGVRITFLPEALWGNVAEIVLTAIWLIGLTNAINFLDGIDGLATSLTIVAAGSFGLVAISTGQSFFLLLSSTFSQLIHCRHCQHDRLRGLLSKGRTRSGFFVMDCLFRIFHVRVMINCAVLTHCIMAQIQCFL